MCLSYLRVELLDERLRRGAGCPRAARAAGAARGSRRSGGSRGPRGTCPLLDGLTRVLVGGGDHPDVDPDLGLAAEPPDDAVLRECGGTSPGAPGLISAISSRKMVPPWASSKQPWRRSSAPVKAPLLVAEDLALEQGLRDGRAVHGHERPLGAAGTARGGCAPPAPSRCRSRPLISTGGGRGRRQLDQAVHLLHGRAGAHQAPEPPHC